ncbi:MAG: hypothetical protein QOE70_3645 [Chthoniobacter sp.]|jgi:hypothetical protein|nr:hypothetical protein [Chthoniobacter sp.]
MTTEALRKILAAQPFHPFTLHLADGSQVPVDHPEAIAYRGGRIAVVFTTEENFEVIDLLLVAKLTTRNGAGVSPDEPTPRR